MAGIRREPPPAWTLPPWQLGARRHAVALEHDGRVRTALVYVPSSDEDRGRARAVPSARPAPTEAPTADGPAPSAPPAPPPSGWPVVVMLHGAGGSWRNITDHRWHELGAREGFVVVYPNGTPRDETRDERFATNPQTWNGGAPRAATTGPGSAHQKGVDDVGFLDALLDELAQAIPVDRARVFLAGHSNGAGMAMRYAWERPTRVAAVGIVAGHISMRFPDPPSRPSSPVPLFQIVGDQDPMLPMPGGTVHLMGTTWVTPPTHEAPRRWARWHGLPDGEADMPAAMRDPAVAMAHDDRRWMRDGEVIIRWLVLQGHGHGWPGSPLRLPERMVGPTIEGCDATELLWEFFAGQPRRERAGA